MIDTLYKFLHFQIKDTLNTFHFLIKILLYLFIETEYNLQLWMINYIQIYSNV